MFPLLSVVTDGKDACGLKLEKERKRILFNALPAKFNKKYYG